MLNTHYKATKSCIKQIKNKNYHLLGWIKNDAEFVKSWVTKKKAVTLELAIKQEH